MGMWEDGGWRANGGPVGDGEGVEVAEGGYDLAAIELGCGGGKPKVVQVKNKLRHKKGTKQCEKKKLRGGTFQPL